MENLNQYTTIELNKMINDIKVKHDALKQEIINHTLEIDEIEETINKKIVVLEELEKNYIALIEEITNR
jgi:SMC interacting uncharacterized protein involved in chromosome segregation